MMLATFANTASVKRLKSSARSACDKFGKPWTIPRRTSPPSERSAESTRKAHSVTKASSVGSNCLTVIPWLQASTAGYPLAWSQHHDLAVLLHHVPIVSKRGAALEPASHRPEAFDFAVVRRQHNRRRKMAPAFKLVAEGSPVFAVLALWN